jgi:hypothetical protein
MPAKQPGIAWKQKAFKPIFGQSLTIVPFTEDELRRIVAEQID